MIGPKNLKLNEIFFVRKYFNEYISRTDSPNLKIQKDLNSTHKKFKKYKLKINF